MSGGGAAAASPPSQPFVRLHPVPSLRLLAAAAAARAVDGSRAQHAALLALAEGDLELVVAAVAARGALTARIVLDLREVCRERRHAALGEWLQTLDVAAAYVVTGGTPCHPLPRC